MVSLAALLLVISWGFIQAGGNSIQDKRILESVELPAALMCSSFEEMSTSAGPNLPERFRPAEVNKEDLELRPNEGKVYFRGIPFSGTSVSYYPNGQLAETVDYHPTLN